MGERIEEYRAMVDNFKEKGILVEYRGMGGNVG
jgi:hypothetical protein